MFCPICDSETMEYLEDGFLTCTKDQTHFHVAIKDVPDQSAEVDEDWETHNIRGVRRENKRLKKRHGMVVTGYGNIMLSRLGGE